MRGMLRNNRRDGRSIHYDVWERRSNPIMPAYADGMSEFHLRGCPCPAEGDECCYIFAVSHSEGLACKQ